MNKLGAAGWALAFALALVIAVGIASGGGDKAQAEREARLKAEAVAEAKDDSLRILWAQHVADSLENIRLDSIADAEIQAAQERARVAEAAAGERTRRLRETLNAEQQAELDEITAYWQQAFAEGEAVVDSLQSKLRRAEAQAAANLGIALQERERGDRWKAAYDAAVIETETLRKKDVSIFGLISFNVGCAIGATASYDALPRDRDERRVSLGGGVTCGVET